MHLHMAKRMVYIVLIVLSIIIIFYLKAIVIPVFLSIIIAYILNPLIKLMTLKGLNKRLSAVILLLIITGAIFLLIFLVVPGLIRDMISATGNMEQYSEKFTIFINDSIYKNMPKYFRSILDNNVSILEKGIISYLNKFINQIIDFSAKIPIYIVIPIFVYYFMVDADFFLNIIKRMIPIEFRKKYIELGREIDRVIGGFIRSQIILSVIVALMTFIILIIFKIKYPIILAFINGAANLIPYFGPIIGLIPAVFIGLIESPNKAILILVAFLILQQLESNIIAPKLVGDSIGLHPVFIILVLLIGGEFFGTWGLILSIPIGGIIKVAWKYLVESLY
jgi:predicted PurR-regulated permease PerM